MAWDAQSLHVLPVVPTWMPLGQVMMRLLRRADAAPLANWVRVQKQPVALLPTIWPRRPLLRTPCMGIAHVNFPFSGGYRHHIQVSVPLPFNSGH